MPTINFNLTPEIDLETVVGSQGIGTNNYATVNIMAGGITYWSGTLLQTADVITIPEIEVGSGAGSAQFVAGGTFTLTVPTTLTEGSVTANLEWTIPPKSAKQTFDGIISQWSLNSQN